MNKAKSILLVEDDASDQYFFMQAIRDIGDVTMYDVANNGQEALEKLRNATTLPDIIFTDIKMPVMGGKECLMEIIRDPTIKNIPVVVLSSDVSEVNNVREMGARAFIKKQEDYHSLRRHLEHVLNIDFDTETDLAAQTFETALGIN